MTEKQLEEQLAVKPGNNLSPAQKVLIECIDDLQEISENPHLPPEESHALSVLSLKLSSGLYQFVKELKGEKPDFKLRETTKVTRKSVLTGKINQMDISVDRTKPRNWLKGTVTDHVQNYFPELSADEREFLLNGVTAEEREAAFPPEED